MEVVRGTCCSTPQSPLQMTQVYVRQMRNFLHYALGALVQPRL
jgi:hypothetical protein